MPFYEYQCQRCGHHLEAMQKVSDRPLKKCPECGKPALTRLMSAPVFRLKGGGWYETDFKSDGEGKRNLADKPDPAAAKDDKKDAAETAAGAKDGAPKDAAPKDAAGKEAAGKETPGREAQAKEAAPKDAASKNEKKPTAATSSASKKGRRNVRRAASRRR
jgi:putative FmdB family regulatory protein